MSSDHDKMYMALVVIDDAAESLRLKRCLRAAMSAAMNAVTALGPNQVRLGSNARPQAHQGAGEDPDDRSHRRRIPTGRQSAINVRRRTGRYLVRVDPRASRAGHGRCGGESVRDAVHA